METSKILERKQKLESDILNLVNKFELDVNNLIFVKNIKLLTFMENLPDGTKEHSVITELQI